MGAQALEYPVSPLNPHRTLVAAGEDALNHGQLTVRGKTGASVSIRVVQETVREDLNMRKVRWAFSEGSDKFEIELKHGRTSGLRKIYVNQVLQERVKSLSNLFSTQESTHEFSLVGQTVTRAAKVLITKNGSGWAEYTYQLMIDGSPIQLLDQTDSPASPIPPPSPSGGVSSRRDGAGGTPPNQRRPSFARSFSFTRRNSAANKAIAEQFACFHLVTLDKAQGKVGITVSNSERLINGKRRVGVVLIDVDAASISRAAGLNIGDVIMAVNGTKVNDHVDCIREVDAEPVLQLKVWGLTSSRSLRLFRQPGLRFGVSVADNEIGPGVLISELTKDGLCFRQGLRVGDVVLSINGRIVDDHQAAIDAVDASKEEVEFVYVPGWREAGGELGDMEA